MALISGRSLQAIQIVASRGQLPDGGNRTCSKESASSATNFLLSYETIAQAKQTLEDRNQVQMSHLSRSKPREVTPFVTRNSFRRQSPVELVR